MIFDAHLDLAWNALEWNRNLELPVDEIRKFEQHFEGIVPGDCTVSFPEMKRGGVGTCIATLLPRLHRKDAAMSHYQSREAGYAACKGQRAFYTAMCAKGVMRELPDLAALEDHLQQWQSGNPDDLPIGFVLSMEGSPSILHPEQVHEWYEDGLRLLGPAHYGEGPYCYGTGSEGGLKPGGKELLQAMEQCGMLLDATHLADQSFWEALEVYSGPVIASHHGCRAITPVDRQLTDEQIKALAERGAVIGLPLDSWMLVPGWKPKVTDPKNCSLDDAVKHTDHIVQLLGTTQHCGIGTDLDGGFGKEQCPHDLETIAELPKIAELLEKRGYSAEDVEGIMWRNYVDFFRRAWA